GFVAKEIEVALEQKQKKLVPVLLCSTPLPKPFATRQWIDLRRRISHECADHEEAPTTPAAGGFGELLRNLSQTGNVHVAPDQSAPAASPGSPRNLLKFAAEQRINWRFAFLPS